MPSVLKIRSKSKKQLKKGGDLKVGETYGLQIKYVRDFARLENNNQNKILSTVDGADAKKSYNLEMIDMFFSVIYNCKCSICPSSHCSTEYAVAVLRSVLRLVLVQP